MRLINTRTLEPAPRRVAEVERLRRGIEPMMRGEHFDLF
jgi:hypothetical protein